MKRLKRKREHKFLYVLLRNAEPVQVFFDYFACHAVWKKRKRDKSARWRIAKATYSVTDSYARSFTNRENPFRSERNEAVADTHIAHNRKAVRLDGMPQAVDDDAKMGRRSSGE